MALGAVHGSRRRMPELRDRPLLRPVTLSAVLAQEPDVPILVGMAGRAIQDRFLWRETCTDFRRVARGLVLTNPGKEVVLNPLVFIIWQAFGSKMAEADLGQCRVVHANPAPVTSLMLAVALDAAADAGVECSWLALQQGLVVGVAGNTAAGFDTLDRRVTGGAVMSQKRVRLGQVAGEGHALPGRLAQHPGTLASGMTWLEVEYCKHRNDEGQR